MDLIERRIHEQNNTARKEFSGLSPFELYLLINKPLQLNCPIQINQTIDTDILDKIPFFRICEEFLKILKRDGFIKLTPLGALPKKVIVEVYQYRFITSYLVESGLSKLSREHDFIALLNARYVCEVAKLIKKRNGKLSLTKFGEKQLEDRQSLFQLILTTFLIQFNWSFNDSYTEEPVAQHGNLYTIYCLLKYGDKEQKTDFYFQKYRSIFPQIIELFENNYSNKAETDCLNRYLSRSFSRFTNWFGFTIPSEGFPWTITISKATELMYAVFKFEHKKGYNFTLENMDSL